MDDIDPRAALERLILENTCEWCGQTRWDGREGQVPDVVSRWCCRKVEHGGYTSKHWRYWRVCFSCWNRAQGGPFANFIFPVIANMPQQGLMEQLVAVQPMAQPAPQVLYMDYVVGPEGARRLPERHPLLRRYAEVELDERNYGRGVIDAAKDKEDATALVCAVLKNREPVRGRTKHVVMFDDANFRLVDKA